jgi:hypothetical protein
VVVCARHAGDTLRAEREQGGHPARSGFIK